MSDTPSGLRPSWLFMAIVAILLGHYVYLGVQLRLCFGVVEREANILLDKLSETDEDVALLEEQFQQSGRVCQDLGDQFRNARNKAVEIILALLVPSGLIMEGQSKQPAKKEEERQPPPETPPGGPPVTPAPGWD